MELSQMLKKQVFTLEEAQIILDDLRYANEHKIITTLGVFSWQWVRGETTKKGKEKWWVAGRFANPQKAKGIYCCNPNSGKYNFHGHYNDKLVCIMTPLQQLMNHLEGLKQNNRLL